ncbi:MAG: response regulator [Myxococcota bacterium]
MLESTISEGTHVSSETALGTEATHSILLVDDDDRFRTRLEQAFRSRGYSVYAADCAASARSAVRDHSIDFVVLDLRLREESGLDLLADLLKCDPDLSIVLLTGYGSIATAIEAVKRGAIHYLTKPVDVDDILRVFTSAASRDKAAVEIPATVPSLARVEWEHINAVLTDCEGNVTRAARALGMHRRTLQRKLAKYPVPR